MTSALTGAAQQVAQAAHSGITSLLAVAEIQPGGTLPSYTVKEDDPQTSFSIDNISGKNIIVRNYNNCFQISDTDKHHRSVYREHSALHAALKSQGTSKIMRNSKQRTWKTSTSLPSMMRLLPSSYHHLFSKLLADLISAQGMESEIGSRWHAYVNSN